MSELREFAGILGAALIAESWHEGPATRVSQLLRRLGQACLEAAKDDGADHD